MEIEQVSMEIEQVSVEDSICGMEWVFSFLSNSFILYLIIYLKLEHL